MDYVKVVEDHNLKLCKQLEAMHNELLFINKWFKNKLKYEYRGIIYPYNNEYSANFVELRHDKLRWYIEDFKELKTYQELIKRAKGINWENASSIDYTENLAISFVVDGLHPSRKVSARCLSFDFYAENELIKCEVTRHEGWTRGWAL
jgi:hypothetical protein